MIAFDFQYYRPKSLNEAVDVYSNLENKTLSPIYYSGGTEIITMARKESLKTKALIDIKDIPDTLIHEEKDGEFIFGANLSLNEIVKKNLFPLLSKVIRPIADHTVRNKITLGGNICGRLPYREAILPLLLVDAKALLAGPEGIREESLDKIFDKRFLLKKGEFLVQIKVDNRAINLPHFNQRRVKQTEIDYPIVHLVALQKKANIKMAFSGLSALPFKADAMDQAISQKQLPLEDRINNTIKALPLPIKTDHLASSDYRRALLERSLFDMIASLEGVSL